MIQFLIIFFLSVCLTYSQITTWPPGGTTPSSKFTKYKLPDSRYVPSSQRWNLVWADQIVPSWVTPGKVEFAAKNYIGTQKIWASQAQEFRNFNNNFLILIYHLAAGLNPAKNSDCPDPKSNSGDNFIGVVAPKGYVSEYREYFEPWLTSKGISVGSQRFEAMFQHYDSLDINHRVWHQDPYWLMNMANQEWADYQTETTLDWIKGNKNEGCFFDVAVETNCSLYNPKQSNPSPQNFDWWLTPHKPYGYSGEFADRSQFALWMNDQFKPYFQKIYKKFHTSTADYLIIPNIDQMVTTVYDPTWVDNDASGDVIDGAMLENFGGYGGQDMYLTLERGFRHITKPNKILIAQFGAADSAERMRRAGMYMLIKNQNSYINIINTGNVEWYPEYEIDLGNQDPLPARFDDMRVKGTDWHSLWRRTYENGMVLCNTSDQALTYNPYGEGWSRVMTSGGGEVGSDGIPKAQSIRLVPFTGQINVPPSQCVILKKDTVAGLENENPTMGVSNIFPNPCKTTITIECMINGKTSVIISVYDLMLNKIKDIIQENQRPGEFSISLDINELAEGIYILEIKQGIRRIYKYFIKSGQ